MNASATNLTFEESNHFNFNYKYSVEKENYNGSMVQQQINNHKLNFRD